MGVPERKKEIVDVSLRTFMKYGLAQTSIRDLCKVLGMTPSNIFYYFDSKDELVIACIEEARARIERDLFGIALKDLDEPEKLAKDLHDRADKQRDLMRFFVTACITAKYEDAVQPSLNNLTLRYRKYTEVFAERLCTTTEVVAPYVYIVINTMLSYMLFAKGSFDAPQLELVYNALNELLEQRETKRNAQIENIKEKEGVFNG